MALRTFVFTSSLFLGLAAIAAAGPIAITNASFETLPDGGLPFNCGTGCAYSIGSIPGWTTSGNTGQFQPGGTVFNSVPDGNTVAYSNTAGALITQNVGSVLAAGVVYTLQVDLGYRTDAFESLGIVQLLIGSTPITATGVIPTSGNWSTYTATYTSAAEDIGNSVTIQLAATGSQSDFDNVRLDASSSTPEPMSTALVGMGLGALGLVRRRKKV